MFKSLIQHLRACTARLSHSRFLSAFRPVIFLPDFLQGRVLIQNVTGGVILAGNSLALQGVKRQQAGRYTCSATNPLGTATSDPVTLKIKCECWGVKGNVTRALFVSRHRVISSWLTFTIE
ncbi:hypothetical protein E2C01_088798 [Portunus trituberculatus]|uniref:Down syndrome cell adhesion molecule-like protein Dscam2 n=1 Tax=Portunus trituberculatus TaxID=210409 RepID=A0A5B7J749_PORTR|nr:hypothetical protein [Portunus trituberculatus]